jgi:uncharacterized protein (TIGR02270 family)
MLEQVASIPEVVWQFGENCAALWEDRERAARSRVYRSSLADLTALDSRIDAQLDGLRVSGSEGWRVVVEGLELDGAGEIFAASTLAFERPPGPDGDPIDALSGLISKPFIMQRPVAVALDWIAPQQKWAAMERSRAKGHLITRGVMLMAQAASGVECTPQIIAALEEGDITLAQAACWAAVRLGARSVAASLHPWLESEAPPTRLIAAHAALLLGGYDGPRVLEQLAVSPDLPVAEEAVAALFHWCQPSRALSLHRDLFGGEPSRTSVCAARAAGIPELMPSLLDCLAVPALSRLAGESISEITGIELSNRGLTLPDAAAGDGPLDDTDDEDTEIGPDAGLPRPDPAAVRSWWASHCGEFARMTRYLAGQPVQTGTLKQLLRRGLQRPRAVAAELLALSGWPLFDVCAPAFRQCERLAGDDLWR